MKSITPENYTIRPFRVNKSWTFSHTYGAVNDGVFIDLALAPPSNWNTFVSGTNVNTSGIHKQLLYRSAQHLFYTGSTGTSESVYVPAGDARRFYPTGSAFYVVNIAQQKFGEGVREGTFRLTSAASTASIYDDGHGRLVSSTAPTTVIGNIFYGVGVAVIQQDTGSFSGSLVTSRGLFMTTGSTINVQFSGIHTIYEHQVICTMDPGEFNYTSNPSARNRTVSGSVLGSGSTAQDLIASGTLTPYFTTVGLYNDMYELVAIAKVPSPISRVATTQQSIIIRFDA
jgi:hypothetical protein